MRATTPRIIETPEHLVTFRVEGRAVPWKAAEVKKWRGEYGGVKDKRLAAWQVAVSIAARVAWGTGRDPYNFPVGLALWFYLRDRGPIPDLTNLVKATEDGLRGVVITDDRLVCSSHQERYQIPLDEPERAFVQVWALPRGGYEEPTDPGPFAFRPWEWVL